MRLYVSTLWVALVTALLAAIPAEAQLTDIDCVAIVDSVGTRVARVTSGVIDKHFFYKGHNGFTVPFRVNKNDFMHGVAENIWFTDANCSSTPFVQITFGNPSATSVLIGQDVYYAEPAAVPQRFQALSKRSTLDLSCQPTDGFGNFAPAIGQFTLPQYTPPFFIEPEACFTPAPRVAALTPYGLGAMALVLSFGAYLMVRRPTVV